MRIRNLLASLLLCSGSHGAFAAEELVSLQSRDGVEQRYLLITPEHPRAAVILFAGGKGVIGLDKGDFGGVSVRRGGNFLVRSRDRFAGHGLLVAVVDAPSDQQGRRGMLGGFRGSAEHVRDIDAVIDDLQRRANIPVWLVGTSRGTESAAFLAIHSSRRPHGLVLTSAMSVRNDNGEAVTEMALDQIRIPTLLVAHEQDGCSKTPAAGAEDIRAGLTAASRVAIKYFDGGREEGNPCKARSHHGFLGIEDQVVAHIADFIKAN